MRLLAGPTVDGARLLKGASMKLLTMLLPIALLAASGPVLADAPVDLTVQDARCLVAMDAVAREREFKDVLSLMLRGYFAGRLATRVGTVAGKQAVQQARADSKNPALVPAFDTCKAVMFETMGE